MSSKSFMRFASRYSCWSSLRCRTILVLWPNALPSCESVHLSTADQCLWALQPWRTKARCICVRCAGLLPCVGSGGRAMAPAKRIAVPAGPWQHHAVHQYSVVRRARGPGGVAIFLNRSASTPPRILIGVFLIPPVCCTSGYLPLGAFVLCRLYREEESLACRVLIYRKELFSVRA